MATIPSFSEYPAIVEILTQEGRHFWKKFPLMVLMILGLGAIPFYFLRTTFHLSIWATIGIAMLIVLTYLLPRVYRTINPKGAWENFTWEIASYSGIPVAEALENLETELSRGCDSFGSTDKLTPSWILQFAHQVIPIRLSSITSLTSEDSGTSLERKAFKDSAYNNINAPYFYKINLVAGGRNRSFEFQRVGQRDVLFKNLLKRLPNLVTDGDGTWSLPSLLSEEQDFQVDSNLLSDNLESSSE